MSGSFELTRMLDRTAWERRPDLIDYLGSQLSQGRITLVLGAGVSRGFGLPDWDELTDRALSLAGATRPAGASNDQAAEHLLVQVCRNDEARFSSLIKEALYQHYDSSLDALRRNDLLAALSVMVMVGRRSTVSQVISFNYDNVLETYLRYHAFIIQSVAEVPSWEDPCDVRVFHPHGYLPRGTTERSTKWLILARIHYDRLNVDRYSKRWNPVLTQLMRSHTCLFIGLSGQCPNLTRLLAETQPEHVSQGAGALFWGVRFGNREEDASLWENRGVYQVTLRDYSELPGWLFEICQKATSL